MKNGKFETQAEIYQFLLDGGAITNLDDSCECYVQLRNGKLMFNTETEDTTDPDQKAGTLHFQTPQHWFPYSQTRLLKEIKKARDWILALESRIKTLEDELL